MDDFLAIMAAKSRRRVSEARKRVSESALKEKSMANSDPRIPPFAQAGFDVIAEVKKRAPSAGRLREENTSPDLVASQAVAYADGGAAVVSVLTEPTAFAGDLLDISTAASAVSIPIMRKDFLVDPYQVFEARAAGASGVLLIAALLTPLTLADALGAVGEMSMFALLELFDDDDLPMVFQAREIASQNSLHLLLGVNARDLKTLDVDIERFGHFSSELPSDIPWIAESGIDSDDAIRHVAALGYRGALVGTALMRSAGPTAMVASMVAAGRAEVAT